MKYFCTIIILFLSTFPSTAKGIFMKASIVDKNNNILGGFIAYDDWDINPQTINFKTTLEGTDIKQFSADSLSAFSIDGIDYFESALVSISMDVTEQNEQLYKRAVDTFIQRSIFLRVIEKGKILNLYSYSDNLKTRFFIKANERDAITELRYQRYLSISNTEEITLNEAYKKQLLLVARGQKTYDDSKLVELLNATNYNKKSLEKVVESMNGSSNEKFPPRTQSKIRYFAGIGLLLGKPYYGGQHELSTNANNEMTIAPKINLGIDIMQNPYIQRIIVRLCLSFDAGKYNISKKMDDKGGSLQHSFTQFNTSLNPEVIYNFYNKEKLKLNGGIGMNCNLSWYQNSTIDAKYNLGGIGGSYNYERKVSLAPLWVTIPVRFGAIIDKKFDLYVQYNFPVSNISNFQSYHIGIHSMQLGVNFLF